MDLPTIFLIALGLSADCFAVALSSSLARPAIPRTLVLRTGLAFGLFQFLMPVIGWLMGQTVVELIASYDHWVAFGLLAIIGGKMVRDAVSTRDREEKTELTRLPVVLVLAVATSIDALAVGLSSAFLKMDIFGAGAIIGVVAFLVTLAGFTLGKTAFRLSGKTARFIGGIILIGIGLRILFSDLW